MAGRTIGRHQIAEEAAPTMLGTARRLLLTPPLSSVTFRARGFEVAASRTTLRLEAIPQAVVCGFEWAIEARDLWQLRRRLSLVEPELRGFAYEGATMAYTVRDAMAAGRGRRTRALLLGPGQPHIFLAYIGIGFAMARLPRPLWRGVLPDLGGTRYHPTMSWLAVDGYGFDRAYFETDRWVRQQDRPAPYPWLGDRDYFPRAVDQGIGRALWFIHGAQAAAVAAAVHGFASTRHADLWSGVGLAATFAGGSDSDGLNLLGREAGAHRAELGLGAVFAAKARDHSGFAPPHTAVALAALAGLSLPAASALADDTAVAAGGRSATTDYERWRSNIRARLHDRET